MHSILIADDDPDILAAWYLILTAEGYQVCCAKNGAEALLSLKERIPDLVITDWIMPLMGGADLCRRIREQPELSHLPILLHTSASLSQKTTRGWNAVLRKPVPVSLFLTTVGRLCRGGSLPPARLATVQQA
jgi:CheY-like chemotaxis protein